MRCGGCGWRVQACGAVVGASGGVIGFVEFELFVALVERVWVVDVLKLDVCLCSIGGCVRLIWLCGEIETCDGYGNWRTWLMDIELDGILCKVCGNCCEVVCLLCVECYC